MLIYSLHPFWHKQAGHDIVTHSFSFICSFEELLLSTKKLSARKKKWNHSYRQTLAANIIFGWKKAVLVLYNLWFIWFV